VRILFSYLTTSRSVSPKPDLRPIMAFIVCLSSSVRIEKVKRA
jgi:hypothetical protein